MLEDNMRSPTESTGDSYNDKVVMTKQGCHDKARLSWQHQLKVLTDDHVCKRDRHDQLVANYLKKADKNHVKMDKLDAVVQYEVHLEDASHDAVTGAVRREEFILENLLVAFGEDADDTSASAALVMAVYVAQQYCYFPLPHIVLLI